MIRIGHFCCALWSNGARRFHSASASGASASFGRRTEERGIRQFWFGLVDIQALPPAFPSRARRQEGNGLRPRIMRSARSRPSNTFSRVSSFSRSAGRDRITLPDGGRNVPSARSSPGAIVSNT